MPANMSRTCITRLSRDCSKLPMSTPDRCLICIVGQCWRWRAATLLHKFSPSTHLPAVPTCLAWCGPGKTQQKKKKMVVMDQQSDIMAMGTSAGTMLVYSTVQGDLVTTLKTENAKITCLVWIKSASCLYAAGEVGDINIHVVMGFKNEKLIFSNMAAKEEYFKKGQLSDACLDRTLLIATG